MKLNSYAKINLNLKVKKKLKNNLHDIETIAVLINLKDEITIKNIDHNKDIIEIKGKFKKYVNLKKNTILDTLNYLRRQRYIRRNYKITLKKNIPVFAGLGGGTGNSVSLAKYFLKKKLINKVKKKIEKKIGTDFRIFFSRWCFQKNLFKVKEFKKKLNFHFLLIYPNIKCSTKEIYSQISQYRKSNNINTNKLVNRKYLIKTLLNEKNDLQKIVEKKHPQIKKIINFISTQRNCIISRMTGSGSVCFGLFRTKKSVKLATIKAKKRFPKYWCVNTKSI